MPSYVAAHGFSGFLGRRHQIKSTKKLRIIKSQILAQLSHNSRIEAAIQVHQADSIDNCAVGVIMDLTSSDPVNPVLEVQGAKNCITAASGPPDRSTSPEADEH